MAEGYEGPVTLRRNETDDTDDTDDTDAVVVGVEARLAAVFEPHPGRLHWYGRVAADHRLADWSGSTVTVTTAHGSAVARLHDCDPWGRYRLSGVGPPPYPLPTDPDRPSPPAPAAGAGCS